MCYNIDTLIVIFFFLRKKPKTKTWTVPVSLSDLADLWPLENLENQLVPVRPENPVSLGLLYSPGLVKIKQT